MENPSNSADVSYTLKYQVERRELSDWYWSAWCRRDGLWQYWLLWLFLILGSALAIAFAQHIELWAAARAGLAVYLVGIGFFVAFPQLTYKPSERSMTVSVNGIDGTRGGKSARRSWKDISRIENRPGYIAITVAGGTRFYPFPLWLRTRSGNAFIVPDKAFASNTGKQAFLESICSWHKAQAVRYPRFSSSRYSV